ncbi:MAG TPA: response regulator [bacterium]|nr:response regulator [bacterium]
MFGLDLRQMIGGKKTVLIINSDENINSILSIRLKNAGFDVMSAAGPEQAYDCLKRRTPKLVLIDNPAKASAECFRFVEWIRSDKRFKKVPIFLLMQESEKDSVERALNIGASDYIVKPFNPGVLVEKIKKATGR